MSPYQAMYGETKDVSDFRAFGCSLRAWVYLDKQRQEKEKHTPRGNIRRVHQQYKRVGILHCGGSEIYELQSSQVPLT